VNRTVIRGRRLPASLEELLTSTAVELVDPTLIDPSGGGGLTLVGA
jgi:hypothetical protein